MAFQSTADPDQILIRNPAVSHEHLAPVRFQSVGVPQHNTVPNLFAVIFLLDMNLLIRIRNVGSRNFRV
jgi:hypothetical protein